MSRIPESENGIYVKSNPTLLLHSVGFHLIKAGSFGTGNCCPFIVTKTVWSSALVSRTTKATKNLPVPSS